MRLNYANTEFTKDPAGNQQQCYIAVDRTVQH